MELSLLLICQMEGSVETWIQSIAPDEVIILEKFKEALFKRFKCHENTTSQPLDVRQSPGTVGWLTHAR